MCVCVRACVSLCACVCVGGGGVVGLLRRGELTDCGEEGGEVGWGGGVKAG